MPTGEIIAIGTELLLGEIQDTNTSYIARKFRDHGIDIYRTTIVGDNSDRISQIINEALSRADILITTGGLGPTVDDPTRAAVAKAFDDELVFKEDLWKQIEDRFKRFGRVPSENNRRQAYIPSKAIAIENPVGTAPSFYLQRNGKIIVSLPGVPREMEYLLEHDVFPLLKNKYTLDSVIKALVIHTAGIGESTVDELVGDLELASNPTVGLLAHPGQTDVRITAKAASPEEADRLIKQIADIVFERLGVAAFGVDDQTLKSVTGDLIEKYNGTIHVIECGFGDSFKTHFDSNESRKMVIHSSNIPFGENCFEPKLLKIKALNDDLIFGFCYEPAKFTQKLSICNGKAENLIHKQYSYGGPSGLGPQWAVNTCIDFIRRRLMEEYVN